MNKISITAKYNKNMIPCIIFGEYGWNFIFVDTKNNKCVKSEEATTAWMNRNNITANEFSAHIWSEYNNMKEMNVECGMFAYFTKDDEKVYNYSQSINVADSYIDIFNF